MYSIEQRDEQLLHTSAEIRYHIFFDRAAQHLIRVRMEIDSAAKMLVLAMPSWTPGSYKVRDFISGQGNLVVRTADGRLLPYHWVSKNRLCIENPDADSVCLEYVFYGLERSVRMCHINRWHAFLNPSNCLMMVEGREQEIHHVALHHDRTEWMNVSTALSPVYAEVGEFEPVVLGALNYDILADSPLEIGNHFSEKFSVGDSIIEVAVVGHGGNHSPEWIVERTRTIVETEAKMWGGLPFDRYVFIDQLYPNGNGGLEHARCSVNLVDSDLAVDSGRALQFLQLVCHEFFHTWNVKRIRPRELGPFNYNTEVFTRMLWLAEGATSYYDDLMTYRCGFMTKNEYIRSLGRDHLARLARVPGRLQMNVKDSSFLAWVKLYALSPDANNRFPSYYLIGGVFFFLLDLLIIARTNGEKRLDDGMRALWNMYLERPELGLSEEETVDLIESATGANISEIFTEWLNGTHDVDYNEIFAPFGLEWKATPPPTTNPTFGDNIASMPAPERVFTGMSLKQEGIRILVASVEDGSPAAEAGFGVDDELLFINGTRILSTREVENTLTRAGAGSSAVIVASCDGKLYQTILQPIAPTEFTLSVSETATEEQKRLLEIWLAR